MTFRTRKPWPAVAEQRRYVIESRTANGEPCTVIVERQPEGPLLVSFHGAMRTTAAPDPVGGNRADRGAGNSGRCPVMVNISWRRSTKDDQVHAFDLAQIAEPRSFLVALCSQAAVVHISCPQLGRNYNGVVPRWSAGGCPLRDCQRQRMVISSPMIISVKPMRKFQGPSATMNSILSPAR